MPTTGYEWVIFWSVAATGAVMVYFFRFRRAARSSAWTLRVCLAGFGGYVMAFVIMRGIDLSVEQAALMGAGAGLTASAAIPRF